MTDQRPSLLAIDDTPANLLMLGSALDAEFKLQVATSGAMGLALASEVPPDLILLDVMMPEMDGYETCRRIKANPALKNIPVIFVTALTDTAAEATGLGLGAADYITKPINVEIARQRIKNLVEREQLRKSLEQYSHALEDEIAERKLMEADLQRSNAELEQFSYAISHDMRQPLRMITGYLQLLEQQLAGQLDSEKKEFLDFARDGAKRLDQMLVDLLEYSRVGRKGEPQTWVESRSLLDEALLFLRPAIAEAKAEIRIQGHWPRVLVSPDELLRLIQNLIGNAVKFRIADRTPEITVSSEAADHQWRVCVADNGIGIMPEQIKRLFQVFQRLQSHTSYEGTGIGLASCRKIAEHHGGRIWAESRGEGRGSRFCFALPHEAASVPTAPIFDEDILLEQLSGDRELAKTIVLSAMEDMPSYFDRLEAAMAAAQWPEAKRFTHTMKGLLAQLGGVRLAKQMKDADDRLKCGETIDRATLHSLRTEYQQLAATLQKWMQ